MPKDLEGGKRGESLPNGFTCPGGKLGIHPALPHPTSCRLYYVCLNGVTPNEAGCGPGLVFNDVTARCDDPANVPRCDTGGRGGGGRKKRPNNAKSDNAGGGSGSDNLNVNQINKFLELLQNPSIQSILKPEIVEALGTHRPIAGIMCCPLRGGPACAPCR